MESLLNRLEAVTTRLEACSGSPSPPDSSPSTNSNESLAAYDEFIKSHVNPFLHTCEAIGSDVAALGTLAKEGFDFGRIAIEAAALCKKPSDADLLKFVEPLAKIIQNAAASRDNRSDAFNHQSAFAEAIQALQWLLVTPTPQGFVQNSLESGDFYFNKVLSNARDSAQKDLHCAFVKQMRDALRNLKAYIKSFHATGLSWNPKGTDISAFKGGATPAAPSAPTAPVPPPAAPAPPPASTSVSAPSSGAAGMSAVFAEISKGDSVTSGLRKVTADMKTKNRPKEERSAVVPSSVGSSATKKKSKSFGGAKKLPPKESSMTCSQGKWFVEHFRDAGIVTLPDDVQLNQSIYVYRCENCTVQIKQKVKAICMDSCKKTKLVFADVVSTVEVVNCQSVEVATTGTAPSILIDKTAGCQLWLNEACIEANIPVTTSNISEVNIRVPGETADSDWPEIPVPEQFTTKVLGKNGSFTLSTKSVSHG